MKLRITPDSLRLRLSENDVREFIRDRYLENRLYFGEDVYLTFCLAIDDSQPCHANFDGGKITVFVPSLNTENWTTASDFSLLTKQNVSDENFLEIIVERDFF